MYSHLYDDYRTYRFSLHWIGCFFCNKVMQQPYALPTCANLLALPAEKEFTRIFFSGILPFEVERIQKQTSASCASR